MRTSCAASGLPARALAEGGADLIAGVGARSGVGARRARRVRGPTAARADVAERVGTTRAVAVPEIGHVAATLADAGIVAVARPAVVEVGVGVLDDALAAVIAVLAEAREEAVDAAPKQSSAKTDSTDS